MEFIPMKNDIGNALGNRIAKHVFDDEGNLEKSTYYVLDAQGNQMSMYEHVVEGETVNYNLAERNIYGSSQMGTLNAVVDMYDETAPETEDIEHYLGKKYYSLNNHLGNVLTVISDLKIPLDQNNDTEVDGYLASIMNVSDYSPFGVELDGRTISNGEFRYGFQGQESDDEIKGDGTSVNYKYRMHDPRVGRFFSLDPLAPEYPHNSPYAFSENRVIDAIELEGAESKITIKKELMEMVKPMLAKGDVYSVVALAFNNLGTDKVSFDNSQAKNGGFTIFLEDENNTHYSVSPIGDFSQGFDFKLGNLEQTRTRISQNLERIENIQKEVDKFSGIIDLLQNQVTTLEQTIEEIKSRDGISKKSFNKKSRQNGEATFAVMTEFVTLPKQREELAAKKGKLKSYEQTKERLENKQKKIKKETNKLQAVEFSSKYNKN